MGGQTAEATRVLDEKGIFSKPAAQPRCHHLKRGWALSKVATHERFRGARYGPCICQRLKLVQGVLRHLTRAGARVSGDRGTDGLWAVKGFTMQSKRFLEFGEEFRRPFVVHENCCDCAEFYDGCMNWQASRNFVCEGFNRLTDIVPGTYGQQFPASRRSKLANRESPEKGTMLGDGYKKSPDWPPTGIHTIRLPGSRMNFTGRRPGSAGVVRFCPRAGGSVTSAGRRTGGKPNGSTCGATWGDDVLRPLTPAQTCVFLPQDGYPCGPGAGRAQLT